MSGPSQAPEEEGASGRSGVISPDDPRLQQVGFAKLLGENIDYVIKKYEVTLGRGTKTGAIDVPLGEGKQLSRLHARIVYDFSAACWVLEVLGRNGVDLNGTPLGPDARAKLVTGSCIRVGQDVSLTFLLPKPLPALPSSWSQGPSKEPPAPDHPSSLHPPAPPSEVAPRPASDPPLERVPGSPAKPSGGAVGSLHAGAVPAQGLGAGQPGAAGHPQSQAVLQNLFLRLQQGGMSASMAAATLQAAQQQQQQPPAMGQMGHRSAGGSQAHNVAPEHLAPLLVSTRPGGGAFVATQPRSPLAMGGMGGLQGPPHSPGATAAFGQQQGRGLFVPGTGMGPGQGPLHPSPVRAVGSPTAASLHAGLSRGGGGGGFGPSPHLEDQLAYRGGGSHAPMQQQGRSGAFMGLSASGSPPGTRGSGGAYGGGYGFAPLQAGQGQGYGQQQGAPQGPAGLSQQQLAAVAAALQGRGGGEGAEGGDQRALQQSLALQQLLRLQQQQQQ